MDTSARYNAGIPQLGTWVLYAFIVTAAFAFGLAIIAATDPRGAGPRYLRAARMAALGTCALIAFDVFLLLYAFVSHDFRVRYVMRYSDRSMPVMYLITALWGGQDGSLMWWTFLLSLYTGACVLWLRGRYRELAPYVVATLMVIVMFFGVLMAYAANPFSANVAGGPPDGEGLNPSLQNFYMAIHPPSLYTGFVGCSVPFAFAIAALCTGRMDEEWIRATRRWSLFSWLFLSIGNVLGMLWAYEELGWGGFWAWDPVENAACLPWFTCTAYLHSFMIQERRQSLKLWNVALVIGTFLLTIFGTFLTRSGLIASIHAFAQSDVGTYFLYFLAFTIAVSVALVAKRFPLLRKRTEIDSVLSREAMFVANNWMLLGCCVFILLATTWPKISEWLWHERLTVGPSFYNSWLSIPGLTLLALVGIGTLTPWRKATPALMFRAFRWPLLAGFFVALAHIALGRRIGFPAFVTLEPIYTSTVGRTLARINGVLPPVGFGLIAFNIAALVQEFYRGTEARTRSKGESAPLAFFKLIAKNRRRYGGYTVHLGIALMFLGFIGGAWKQEAEATVAPGENFHVGRYILRYDGVESRRDPNTRQIYARVTVWQDGHEFAHIRPAKFIYTTHPDSPTSEVSISMGLRDDLYVVMASVNPTTHVAHLKAFVNPLVSWIWIGALVLILGCAIAMWPEVSLAWLRGSLPAEPGVGSGGDGGGGGGGGRDGGEGQGEPATAHARSGTTALLALVALGAGLALAPRAAHAQNHVVSAPPPVGGESEAISPREHQVFDRLLCMCGGCQRLPLATCTCDFAAATRASMRERLDRGTPAQSVIDAYVARYGSAALAVPPDAGHNRGVYAIPIVGLLAGAGVGVWLVRRWHALSVSRRLAEAGAAHSVAAQHLAKGTTDDAGNARRRSEYDRRLDEDLRDLDD